MTKNEALKLALEALELYQSKMSVEMFDAAITALRQALEQPERELVGLTDEELRHAYGEVSGNEWCLGGISNAETFYDVIEAKLKEKNT